MLALASRSLALQGIDFGRVAWRVRGNFDLYRTPFEVFKLIGNTQHGTSFNAVVAKRVMKGFGFGVFYNLAHPEKIIQHVNR